MLIFLLDSLIYSWVFSQPVWHVVSWFSMWKCFDAFANFACINFLAFADFWALLISLSIFLFLLFLIIPGSLTTLCWVVSAFSWIVFSGQWSAFSASPSILPSCQEIPVQEWQASLSDMTPLALCSLPAEVFFFFFLSQWPTSQDFHSLWREAHSQLYYWSISLLIVNVLSQQWDFWRPSASIVRSQLA